MKDLSIQAEVPEAVKKFKAVSQYWSKRDNYFALWDAAYFIKHMIGLGLFWIIITAVENNISSFADYDLTLKTIIFTKWTILIMGFVLTADGIYRYFLLNKEIKPFGYYLLEECLSCEAVFFYVKKKINSNEKVTYNDFVNLMRYTGSMYKINRLLMRIYTI